MGLHLVIPILFELIYNRNYIYINVNKFYSLEKRFIQLLKREPLLKKNLIRSARKFGFKKQYKIGFIAELLK